MRRTCAFPGSDSYALLFLSHLMYTIIQNTVYLPEELSGACGIKHIDFIIHHYFIVTCCNSYCSYLC